MRCVQARLAAAGVGLYIESNRGGRFDARQTVRGCFGLYTYRI